MSVQGMRPQTIQAIVNTRLLAKASRLFTGTLHGRIIEILQNARRAGANRVEIINRDGTVTVRDDGRGIDDFHKLLDLGGSGWEEALEASEDPAGVGLFCLAPRPLRIRSKSRILTIAAEGWTGAAVEVRRDPQSLPQTPAGIPQERGTELQFPDEPWTASTLKPLAAFTGMEVTVDGEVCPREQFITGLTTGNTRLHHALGCRIQVVSENDLTAWHRSAPEARRYGDNVLVNFHGQVVSFPHRPIGSQDLHFLVEMTGEPTGIRLMLPARTRLVENQSFRQLQAALELEAYKHIQRQQCHRLHYKEYLRAQELGIELPEAREVYQVGLLPNNRSPEPVEVTMPQGLPLAACYRLGQAIEAKEGQESDDSEEGEEGEEGDESDAANIHLLAALGRFDRPFVPVEIPCGYDGYAWAKLPTLDKVEVSAGKVLQESWIDAGRLICVESLSLAAHGSDGSVFRSAVCIAVKPWSGKGQRSWYGEYELYVTPQAQAVLSGEQVWYHFGGYSDEGDTYDTQAYDFNQQLDAFWTRLSGPDEPIRRKLFDALGELAGPWKSVTIRPDGQVTIRQANGNRKILSPPESADESAARSADGEEIRP